MDVNPLLYYYVKAPIRKKLSGQIENRDLELVTIKHGVILLKKFTN